MKKKLVRLTESELHKVIKESVNNILSELDWKTYANASRKWADELEKNPSHPKRKSNIVGHEKSKGRHDIYTDNRLMKFNDATQDSFNKEYGFNVYGKDSNKGSYEMDMNYDNIGNHGYYDSYETSTHVPSKYAVVGKTADGKRTETMLKDTFHMDSFDGKDKYPSKRHDARIGFDKKYTKRDAVEPNMDKWDYMQARNKGNQEILDYVNGEYEYSNGKWAKGGFSIFGDDEETDVKTYRLPFCYAHGQLEDELGFDIFKTDIVGKKKIMSKDGMDLKIGTYKCNYNGKPCTLYVGWNKSNGPRTIGFCCYNDDENAINYINSQIMY